MGRYDLTEEAENDIREIVRYTFRQVGRVTGQALSMGVKRQARLHREGGSCCAFLVRKPA